MRAIPTVWLKNTPKEKQVELEKIIRGSTTALSRLYDLIEEKEQSITNQKFSDFDNPNWANKQAYYIGKQAALKELKELLEFIKG